METESTDRNEKQGHDRALGILRAWLVTAQVAEEDALGVVEGVKNFYVNAFGLLGFPPAIGIDALQKRERTLNFCLFWPDALSTAERRGYERSLRAAFDREVSKPFATTLSCRLTFGNQLPASEAEYPCYLGPRVRGYQAFAASFLAAKQALNRSPAVAQELAGLVRRFPEHSKQERRLLAHRVSELISQLRSA